MDEQQRLAKKALEDALAADRYDLAAHRVLADLLEEAGLDDEAEFHRSWTPEWQRAYDAAERWLYEFAESVGLSYEQVIEAGHEFLKDGYGLDTGVNMAPENAFYGHQYEQEGKPWIVDDYWANWRTVMQCYTPFDPDDPDRIPFKCSC